MTGDELSELPEYKALRAKFDELAESGEIEGYYLITTLKEEVNILKKVTDEVLLHTFVALGAERCVRIGKQTR